MIGTLGPILFSVSADKVQTFQSLSHSASARWVQHEVVGQEPVSEFVGPGLKRMTIQVRLDASLGVDVQDMASRIQEARRTGHVCTFTLGEQVLGDYVITEYTQDLARIGAHGERELVNVSLTLEAYGG
jgi:phage protein U